MPPGVEREPVRRRDRSVVRNRRRDASLHLHQRRVGRLSEPTGIVVRCMRVDNYQLSLSELDSPMVEGFGNARHEDQSEVLWEGPSRHLLSDQCQHVIPRGARCALEEPASTYSTSAVTPRMNSSMLFAAAMSSTAGQYAATSSLGNPMWCDVVLWTYGTTNSVMNSQRPVDSAAVTRSCAASRATGRTALTARGVKGAATRDRTRRCFLHSC
jgi:hypothetical protein